MYTSITSAKVTRVIAVIIGVILLGLMISSYWILKWFGVPTNNIKVILTAFYICCVPAWIAIVSIFRLMSNIIKDEIFTPQTVKAMRILSWCCAIVTIVCFVSGFFYIPLWIYGLGSAFMTLILRVLKNVMERATQIKDENDMTI